MDLEYYNAYCGSLTATTHVIQWGDAHVWKVGGKVFAIAGWNDGNSFAVTFKTSPSKSLAMPSYLTNMKMMQQMLSGKCTGEISSVMD